MKRLTEEDFNVDLGSDHDPTECCRWGYWSPGVPKGLGLTTYAIVRYRFSPRRGWCIPYYVTYYHSSHISKKEHDSFEEALAEVNEHYNQ